MKAEVQASTWCAVSKHRSTVALSATVNRCAILGLQGHACGNPDRALMHARMYIWHSIISVFACIYLYNIYIYRQVCISINIYIYVILYYVYIYMYIDMYVCMQHVFKYVRSYVCVCVRVVSVGVPM